MKTRVILLLLFCMMSNCTYAQEYKVFHTSICYDFLACIQNYEKLFIDDNFQTTLQNDSVFCASITKINDQVRASNLCNIYSSFPNSSKNDINKCIEFFEDLSMSKIPEEHRGEWANNILNVQNEIVQVLKKLQKAGYEKYWQTKILPMIESCIDEYKFKDGLLEDIHNEIRLLAANEDISNEYSKIYILDIDNAFALNDETFCCTSFLLNEEIAKRYRINFIQVYIHENLHRLYLSPELFTKLENLKGDKFYSENEHKASKYGEGRNEAFIVAAESFISHRLGLKSSDDVFLEFTEYVDGSLVLAPIVYNSLPNKLATESFNDFLLKLFDENKFEIGRVKEQYEDDLNAIRSGSDSVSF